MTPSAASSLCAHCGAALSGASKYCSQCGHACAPAVKWYYNVWFVLFTLFFVAGPLGLPLVWKNPRFSRAVKIALTLIMALYTYWLVDLTLKMVKAIMGQMSQFGATLPY